MKKALLAIVAVLAAVAANAQGFVQFNNRVVGTVDVPATINGSIGATAAEYSSYTVGLIDAGSGNVLGTTTFRTAANRIGYVNAIDVDIGAGAKSLKWAAWQTTLGANTAGYAAGKASGQNFGESTAFSATGGVPPATPEALTGLTALNIVTVPEPTTLALAALGGLALVVRRRK